MDKLMTKKRSECDSWHEKPWFGFNPEFDPRASEKYTIVSNSMVKDDFYKNHSKTECKTEWARRYNEL